MTDLDRQLIGAVRDSDIDRVKYLVSQGADITTNDNFVVRLASGYGHLDTVILIWLNI